MKLRVNEIFTSFQGEGLQTGRLATFIRLAGCNMDCPFCDTLQAKVLQDGNFVEYKTPTMIQNIEHHVQQSKFVVVTGGEPMVQSEALFDFATKLMREWDFEIVMALESNGSIPTKIGPSVYQAFDHVAIAPKRRNGEFDVCDEALRYAAEIKFVVDDQLTMNEIAGIVERANDIKDKHHGNWDVSFWLQPESDKKESIEKAMDLARKASFLRMGHQMHKLRGWR